MNCLQCSKRIAFKELAISCESGQQKRAPVYGNLYFEGNEDTVAHARCSPWFDMTKNFINECNEVSECAVCTSPIRELDLMVRVRVGLANMDNDILEEPPQFTEKYFHAECALEYFEEDWLFWNE